MVITTYNKGNPPIKQIISKHCQILDRSTSTWPLTNKNIVVTFRKTKSTKDIHVRAKAFTSKLVIQPQCSRPTTYQSCTQIFHNSPMTIHNTTHSFLTFMQGYFQSNNTIYCLKCNICYIKYVGQTWNRNFFDIRNHINTTVARHFASHGEVKKPHSQYKFWKTSVSNTIPRSMSIRQEGDDLDTQVRH